MNEEKYRLKRCEGTPWRATMVSIWMGVIVFSQIMLLILLSQYIEKRYSLQNICMIILMLTLFIVVVICTKMKYFRNGKDNKSDIKELGEKDTAYITDIGYRSATKYNDESYYICVSYNNRKMEVGRLQNNNAYRILKLLLNPYPIKKEVKIPVDVYVYKKSVYVDFENVELSKIKGYNEAVKIIETM